MSLIDERVKLARAGKNPYCIGRMESGWLVIGDVQPLEGYCLLLADPVVGSLNDLPEEGRAAYCRDMGLIGDALLKVTGAYRINYETWGNLEPALHTHVMPRYWDEPEDKRVMPACKGYDWKTARPFDGDRDREFMEEMRAELGLKAPGP